jgi:hypothetical protein
MPSANPNNRSTPWGLMLLTASMLMLILYSGLHYKGDSDTNDVFWLEDQAGIRFGSHGIVHGQGIARSTDGALSISLALRSGNTDDRHFRLLLLLHGGDDDKQLAIGQWRSWLIIMNGDDYNARRRRARIALDVLQPHRERFVTVTSGDDGTTVYIDGKRAQTKKSLRLEVPAAGGETQLVLGNSIYGRHPWEGHIYGLAFFDRILPEKDIARHFAQWQRLRRFAFALSEKASGSYLFDEGRGRQVTDQTGGHHNLKIPEKMTILSKEFLTAPFGPDQRRLYQDMIINIMGFIPMGFLLSALLCHANRHHITERLVLAMLACGIVSLSIELAQAWIPTRSSHLLDWILNTLGAGVGVLFHRLYTFIFGPGPSGS